MYSYQDERPKLFTEAGQILLLTMVDTIQRKCAVAGCVRAQEAMEGVTGDSWTKLAVFDRLIELGRIQRIPQPHEWAQHHIYIIVGEGK